MVEASTSVPNRSRVVVARREGGTMHFALGAVLRPAYSKNGFELPERETEPRKQDGIRGYGYRKSVMITMHPSESPPLRFPPPTWLKSFRQSFIYK